jgi:hypothetical protein
VWYIECITMPRFSICINSEICLRQYDPSSYLFVLVMGAFSRFMDSMTKN